jgi:hypothetical protein
MEKEIFVDDIDGQSFQPIKCLKTLTYEAYPGYKFFLHKSSNGLQSGGGNKTRLRHVS